MTYQHFAYVYDKLMEDAPYDLWLDFFQEIIKKYGIGAETVLDVGCGTGSMLLKFAEAGYKPTGIDLSSDMLTIAKEKLQAANLQVPLFEQNMTNIMDIGPFDAIVAFCDSLNYLETEDEVNQAFSCFYNQLDEGGLFIFDVHSLFKINEVFVGATFADDDDDVSYIWKGYEGGYPNSVEHQLTFFVKKQTDAYERVEELHKQRTFSIEAYSSMLKKHGFDLLEVAADFKHSSLVEHESERIFFVAKKGKRESL